MDARADEFVAQSREHLALVEQILLALEKSRDPDTDREQIDHCLRLVHSLKGDAGFLGYTPVRTLADAMETVLEALRNAEIPTATTAVETLLVARDRLAALVDDLEHSHEADLRELLAQLEAAAQGTASRRRLCQVDLRQLDRLCGGSLAGFFAACERCREVTASTLLVAPFDLSREIAAESIQLQLELNSTRSDADILRDLSVPPGILPDAKAGELSLAVDLAEWVRWSSCTLGTLLTGLDRLGKVADPRLEAAVWDLRAAGTAGPVILRGRLRTPLSAEEACSTLRLPPLPASDHPIAASREPAPSGGKASPPRLAVGEKPPPPPHPGQPAGLLGPTPEADRSGSLRIGVELLDRLMTLTGELTLIRNQSVLAVDQVDGPLRNIVQRLNSVTSELQETVLRTRMQPIGNLFGKFPRVVRDLGRQLGKQVDVTLIGREVELDKTILEHLSDPLTHLIRNSVDHGIESPADRLAAGKPPTGQIVLTAGHEEGQVRIEIRDDGRGIDPQAVRAKALALRLASPSELDRMPPRELLSLILLPGFSTARQVTEVSGRGVGMDVVQTNIRQLEGSLTIDSEPGAGTAMILRVPLTLAIIPCLIVTVDGERLAIPQRELEEVVCLHPRMAGRIEQAYDTEVYRLRDRLLAIVRVGEVFRNPSPFTAEVKSEILRRYAAANREPTSTAYLVVVRQGRRRFGLLVDEICGTEEIVVKPMNAVLKRVGLFAGATIMGDGRVALIADVAGIIRHARISFDTERPEAAPTAVRDAAQVHRVLLFEYGPHERFALPLLQIRRIESLSPDRIEQVGGHEFVSIDGVATRILRLDHVLPVSACEPGKALHLVLPKYAREPTGILVSRIVDAESLAVELQAAPQREAGILGTALVHGRLTLFLDAHYLVEKLIGPAADGAPQPSSRLPRVLLVDDTPFFREAVSRYLTGAGLAVTSAIHGLDALQKMSDESFDLIVSDIEMPVMDGWTFARQAREQGYRGPLLALSSLSKPEHEVRAMACGFDDFEEKLNHDRLVATVRRLLHGPRRTRENS